MKKMLSILITGVGAPGIRGTLFALNRNADNIQIRTVGVDMNEEAVGRFWVDAFYKANAPENPVYVESMLNICRREAVDVIIPQTTREIGVLANNSDVFAREGVGIMVSGPESIAVANNKWQVLEVFREMNLPIPAYSLCRTEVELVKEVYALGYPARAAVVKPPVSNGMRGFRILKDQAWDSRRFLAEKPSGEEISLDNLLGILRRGDEWPELLVTEFLPGPEYSVDAFIGERCQIAVPRLRKSIRSGISFENVIEAREDLIRYTLQCGNHMSLRYAFGFQFKLDAYGEPKVLECNPRVQGTMVASVFAGVNMIWLGVRELCGDPADSVVLNQRRVGFQRYWGGIGLTDDEYEEI